VSAKEIFENIKANLEAQPDKLAGLNASYQFDLSGEGGGTFFINVADGKIEVGEGAAESPGCTVSMSASDFADMVEGRLNPTAAFMSGKLKIKGDMGLAMKLQALLG